MKTRWKVAILQLILSLAAITAAAWEYGRIAAGDEIFTLFRNQFFFILGSQFLLSVVLVFIRRSGLIYVFLGVKWFFLIVLGYPLEGNLGIETILSLPLLVEMGVYLKRNHLYAVFPVYIVMMVLLQRPVLVWNHMRSAPESMGLLHFGLFCATVAGFVVFLKGSLESLMEQEQVIHMLNRATFQLTAANKDFQEHVVVAQRKAERDERNRISREIHDTVGYALTNLIMMMEAATDFSRTDPEKTRDLLLKARRQASDSLDETRRALRELRHIGDAKRLGIQVINGLIQNFSNATGINVEVDYGTCPWSFGNPYDEAIYHIVQEGLVNAFRHGQASRVKVHLWCDAREIRVTVSDNGRGADKIVVGIGLSGMKERLKEIGGRLKAGNTVDGFEISAILPRLPGEDDE